MRLPPHAATRYVPGNTNPEVPMIPARFAPVLFGFVLSALMSLLVSGIAT
jgi:hypothetical protein